jgi:hypothetical protein
LFEEAIQLRPRDPKRPAWSDPNETETPLLEEPPNLAWLQSQDFGHFFGGEKLVPGVFVLTRLGIAHLVPRHTFQPPRPS